MRRECKSIHKDSNKSQNTLEEVMSESDFIFLSVPTPSNADGSINLDIVDKALEEINNFNDRGNIILLRSTMIPGSTRNFQQKYPKLNLVFNPEFLTERSANFDFINQSRFIIGGESRNTTKLLRCIDGDLVKVFQLLKLIMKLLN